MKRSSMRFTIRTLQVAVLGAAILIVICLHVDPLLYWRELAAFLFCPLLCSLMLLIILGRPPARLFAIGFILGFVLEHVTMAYCVSHSLLRFSATTLAPQGSYPLQIAIERMILHGGRVHLNDATVLAAFSGMLLSGSLCALTTLTIGQLVRGTIAVGRRRRSMGAAALEPTEIAGVADRGRNG